jgi:hypothetical protein
MASANSLLVPGARSLRNAAPGKSDSVSRRPVKVALRRGYRKAVAAVAAKRARVAWAVPGTGESLALPARQEISDDRNPGIDKLHAGSALSPVAALSRACPPPHD